MDTRATPALVGDGADGQTIAAAAAVMTMPATAGQTRASIEMRGAARGAATAALVGSCSSSSSLASPIALKRRFGSFSRQRRSSRDSGVGRSGGSSCHLGASFSTFASVIDTSSPSNARRPVNIS